MTLHRSSPCKVNLLLNILGRRPDGFHELETVMLPVALMDELDFEPQPHGIELTCNHPELPVDHRNLVYRAAEGFLALSGITRGIRIHLDKRLPLAAGLGGGSANAAVTLLALNELFEGPLDAMQLHALAATLGSDVPFFLQSHPALATGRGEIIEPLPAFELLRGCGLVLLHPGFGVATAWAYQALRQFPAQLEGNPGRARRLISVLQGRDRGPLAAHLYNSLEAPVLRKYLLLQVLQDFLRSRGVLGALMSGSGSTTFAITADFAAATALAGQLGERFGSSMWIAATPL